MPKGYPYVALLRGINVGGRNPVPMEELRACFVKLGFSAVQTYIQSGNVLFRGTAPQVETIERRLARQFDYHGRVVVLGRRRFMHSLGMAHESWGGDDERKHNALFTLQGTSPESVMRALPPLSEYEQVTTAPGVIFWSGSRTYLTRTMFLKKLAGHPLYQELTVRNHNTVFKLRELLEAL